MEETTKAIKQSCEDQKKGITTFIEVILNQELGEPFRRDAMKKPVKVAGISKGDMKPQKTNIWQLKNKKINISSNRSFGLVFFAVFLIISIWPLLDNQDIRIWSLIVSLIFLILGILNSNLLRPFNKIWFKFGMFLGSIVSPIVMGLVFFLVVTPTGFLMRLFGKDLLKLKKNKNNTYWVEKNYKSNMKDQF